MVGCIHCLIASSGVCCDVVLFEFLFCVTGSTRVQLLGGFCTVSRWLLVCLFIILLDWRHPYPKHGHFLFFAASAEAYSFVIVLEGVFE